MMKIKMKVKSGCQAKRGEKVIDREREKGGKEVILSKYIHTHTHIHTLSLGHTHTHTHTHTHLCSSI